MENSHLTKLVLEQCKKYGDRPALYHKVDGVWENISWAEMARQIQGVSLALLNEGVNEQDRVGIYSQNRPEWTIADYGIMGIRAITTTIYATSSISDLEYIINDAEINFLFIGGQEQYDKIVKILPDNKHLKKVVVFDPATQIQADARVVYFSDFIAQDALQQHRDAFNSRLEQANSEDIATIIYTSGTTGKPKGVMLTHKNITSQFAILNRLFNLSEKDVELCFLPLSHVYQKSSTYWTQSRGVTVYYCENPKEILDYFQEVRPTYMVGVPRLYEKMYAKIYATLEQAPHLKRKLFDWSVEIGKQYQYKVFKKEPVPFSLKLKHTIARKLVLNKIRQIMGSRLNFFSAGGAPLAAEIEEFFFAAGIFIAQGYGLTETSPVVSCNRPDQFKFGTPGKVVSNCQVKIAEDGEILVKGENVMKGYFRKPELTAEVLSEDGWFHTGDIGYLDEDGFLHITDRKKDIIITAGGKNIAPQPIESHFGKDYYIEQIALIGDKRKYVSALVVPSFEALEEWAKQHKIEYKTHADLINDERVINFYQQRIEELSKPWARYESVKKFTLLPEPFSVEKGEITPTLKLKRRVIEQNYKEEIEAMYAEEDNGI